jgi:PilZ domain
MPLKAKFVFHRTEKRILMEIPVLIDGHRDVPGRESTFTENVSARGARVISARHWELGDSLKFASRTGEFRSSARVAYCQSLQGDGFAIGVEFLNPKGRWVVQTPNSLTHSGERIGGERLEQREKLDY